jgi:predicted component of type VI protein secretion system
MRDRDEIILQIAELRRLRAGYERQGKHRFVSYIEQMLGEAEAELRQHDESAS